MATMAGNMDSHGDFRDRSLAVLTVTIVMILICTIFVGLRMISRAAIVKKISWDDYFMVLAWLLACGISVAICYGTAYGLGRHERDVPESWQYGLKKSNYAFTLLYQLALMATKTSILAFYLTFSTANRTFRWACYITLFVVNAGGIALTFVTAFQCTPTWAVWHFNPPAYAQCTNILTIYLASIPLNMITDLALLFLPGPVLSSMRLPRKQKIILMVTFSFGIFVAVVDVVRISYLQSAAETRLDELQNQMSTNGKELNDTTDSSYYLAFAFMWSAIEVTVGIMCACVPGLKPLAARFLPNMLRDQSDPSSMIRSFSGGPDGGLEKMPAPPPMAYPDDVHPRDFGSPAVADEDREMDMFEFLRGRPANGHPPAAEEVEGHPADMVDFLTTPEMSSMPAVERTNTALTNTTRHTAPGTPTFFDFVNMKQRKSLVHLTNRESVYPVAAVTVLFFIWGFEYGLVETLNQQFQIVAKVSTLEAVGIRCAYYCGYFCGPVLAGFPILKYWGFKACYPMGLCIYAAGCLIFWPAAVLTSWPTFVVTNFIVGFGLSVLEISANPYITLCGPAAYGEARLNFSQGVQAIGTVVAPLIANKAFASKVSDAPSLIDTQWAYLGISLATVVLAVIYYFLPLNEVTDVELEDAAERIDGSEKARFGTVQVIWIVLGLGVMSQFCYVGGQEVIAQKFGGYLESIAPGYNVSNYLAISHTAFSVSRFLAAGLSIFVKPRIILLFFYIGVIIFTALSTHYEGGTGIAMMVMVFFCEGPLFSLIFAQTLRGQGKHTRFATTLLTSSIGGGALFSPISTTIIDAGRSVSYSLVVAVAAFAGGTVFAVGLNATSKMRRLVDPIKEDADAHEDDSRPSSMSSRASRALSLLSIGKRNRKESEAAEFRERRVSSGITLNDR